MSQPEGVVDNRLPLFRQAAGVAASLLPSPLSLWCILDRQTPLALKQIIAEHPLNRLFGKAIAEGEFDSFDGRVIRLEITDGPGISLGFWKSRLRIVEGIGDATIRGSVTAFRQLAEQRQDPDQLFFQRQLVIEGDTELGLALKNLLDSLDWRVGLRGLTSIRRLFNERLPLLVASL